MRILVGICFLLMFINQGFSQKAFEITYKPFADGKEQARGGITILVHKGVAYHSQPDAAIQTYTDYNRKQQVTIMKFGDTLYKSIEPFAQLPAPKIEPSKDTLLGYPLQKAIFSYFSNTIEVWFSNKPGVAATPSATYIPGLGALTLRQQVNGGRELRATAVKEVKIIPQRDYDYSKAKTISPAQMEALKIRNRYDVVDVFKEERINFEEISSPKTKEELTTGKTYRFSSGSVILKKINIAKWKDKQVSVFARLDSRSDGDAYDRTGAIFMLPVTNNKQTLLEGMLFGADKMPSISDKNKEVYYGMAATENFEPAVEWMRFFTPFGVGNFNNRRVIDGYDWAKKAYYKQDISELFPSGVDEVWIGAYIGNYDKGGHIINLSLDIYPEGDTKGQNYIAPVFNTLNIMEMSGQRYARLFRTDTLTVKFTIPQGLKNGNLIFTTTGHGGWGNGDEFVPRKNEIFVDGKLFFNVVPWRTDCASYRLYNPASGNFNSGLSSSDLSRSNWCPATITYPYRIPLNGLTPGEHEIKVAIPQGPDEGNSFSFWQVSGVVVGKAE